jgi:polyhydroxybutyrate depolymerase
MPWRVLAVALLMASPGQAEEQRGTVTWQGVERSYLLELPERFGGKLSPLVIALHGAGDNVTAFAAETQFAPAVHGALVVFPQGLEATPGRGSWNAQFCCGEAMTRRVDDIGFIGALIAELAARYPVDRSRVYATGMSNGGMLAYQLAAAHPEWLAAIAPVSATIGGSARNGRSFLVDAPQIPVPVLIMHGRKDQSIPFEGGVAPNAGPPRIWKMSVADALSFWRNADGCGVLPETAEPVPGKLRRTAYRDCRGGSEVVAWEIEDGGHNWPQEDVRFPAPGRPPRSAAAEILAFFAAHGREARQ